MHTIIKIKYTVLLISLCVSCNLDIEKQSSDWNNISEEFYSYVVLMIDKYEKLTEKIKKGNKKENTLPCQEIKSFPYWYLIYDLDDYIHEGKRLKEHLNDAERQDMEEIKAEMFVYAVSIYALNSDKDFCRKGIEEGLEQLYLVKKHLIENADIYGITEFKTVLGAYWTYTGSHLNQYKEKRKEWAKDDAVCENVYHKYFFGVSNRIDFDYGFILTPTAAPLSTISFRQWHEEFAEIQPGLPDFIGEFHLFISLKDLLFPFIEKNLTQYELRLLLENADRKKLNELKHLKSVQNVDFESVEKYEDIYSLDWDCDATLDIILDEMDRKIEEHEIYLKHLDYYWRKYEL